MEKTVWLCNDEIRFEINNTNCEAKVIVNNGDIYLSGYPTLEELKELRDTLIKML